MIISEKQFTIYFGNATTGYEEDSLVGKSQHELLRQPFFKDFSVRNCIVLNQTHGTNGYVIKTHDDAQVQPWGVDGDYSVTTRKECALGVVTADCTPVVFVDPTLPSAAIVHAGWRGSMQGIVPKALADMRALGSKLGDIRVFMGPAARSCCYEVKQDFVSGLDDRAALIERDNRIFFDNVFYIKAQLLAAGLYEDQIRLEHAQCTICTPGFCSYRKDGVRAYRQMTIIALY